VQLVTVVDVELLLLLWHCGAMQICLLLLFSLLLLLSFTNLKTG